MNLVEIIQSTAAISPRTGQKAYDFVSAYLADAKPVTISFDGIIDCTSAFCNTFIGKLYMNFSPPQVDSLVTFQGIEENDIWSKKIHNARLLGTNENVRTVRKSNIDDLILS